MRTRKHYRTRLTIASQLEQRLYGALNRWRLGPTDREYNLTISHEKKIIWFRVAKVGTRTIFHHFKEQGVRLDVEHVFNTRYSPSAYRDYFKFAFVRDPLERFISCWRNKVLYKEHYSELEGAQDIRSLLDFASRIDLDTCDCHLRRQCRLIDTSNLDFLGRMETFDADFRAVCERIGIACDSPQRRNVSAGQPAEELYSNRELMRRVEELYRLDFQTFGYPMPADRPAKALAA